MAPELPLDMQIMIMKRLPMKSLARFKCVSKQWSSLISSQGYLFPSPPRLFISLLHIRDIMEEGIGSANFELLSLSQESNSNSNSSNVFDLDWTKQGMGGQDMVVLRGLIFYTIWDKAYIYNPTTGQRVTLPTIEFNILIPKHEYFFGYDAGLDQYKILYSAVSVKLGRIYSQFWVYVLEAGSSWKRIEIDQPRIPSRQGRCINGVIYYFASRSVFGVDEEVICFDVRSEEFNIIQLPHDRSGHTSYLEFIEYDGKPTLFDCVGLSSGMVNLWVLEDTEKWSKKSLVLQPSHMHFFADTMCMIGTTQNGEVILQPYKSPPSYYILYYDLHRNNVKKVDIRGFVIRGISECSYDLALMDTGESIMHLKI